MVASKSPINSMIFLVMVYLAGGCIFLLLDQYFLGLTLVIVYVGAIAILFLFTIFMVNVRLTVQKTTQTSSGIPALLTTDSKIVCACRCYNKGFLTYDAETSSAVAKDKVVYYLEAKTEKIDYDKIEISSVISAKPNAKLNLLNFDLYHSGSSHLHELHSHD